MKKKFITIGVLLSLLLSPFSQVKAEFRPEFIITDAEMHDYRTMELNEIQTFLERKGSPLASYETSNSEGIMKKASEIIYDASQAHHINPRVLLVLLQKEQSLIQGSPTQRNFDWATGYAVCDSCRTNDPGIQRYKGFGNQVDWAAKRLAYYAAFPYQFNFNKGNLYSIDGEDVMIFNQATASLYNYTPHIHGNYNFWKLWQEWFRQKYPHGSLVKSPLDPTVYRIEYGRKRAFESMSVLLSKYDPSKIITIHPSDLDAYEEAPSLKFPNYSLLEDPQGELYLLVDERLRQFESEALFRKIGFSKVEVLPVTNDDINTYEAGERITALDAFPTGTLLQDEETGGVFYIYNGKRKPIISKEILNVRFARMTTLSKPKETIEQFELDSPVLFPDGELISPHDQPNVYVVEHGKRRPIVSGDVFTKLGYNWDNVIKTSIDAVNLHPMGEPVDFLALDSYNLSILK